MDINGRNHLSYMVVSREWPGDAFTRGGHVILDEHFSPRLDLMANMDGCNNPHEFQVLQNGSQAIYISSMVNETSISLVDWTGTGHGRVVNDCIYQINLRTETKDFAWCPLDHGVSITESFIRTPDLLGTPDAPWDYLYVIETSIGGTRS